MNSKVWRVLEAVPMLLYVLGCIACSTYFLYSFIAIYVQQALISPEIAAVL